MRLLTILLQDLSIKQYWRWRGRCVKGGARGRCVKGGARKKWGGGKNFGTEGCFWENNVHGSEPELSFLIDFKTGRQRIRYRSLIRTYSRPSRSKISGDSSKFVDETSCY